MWGSAASKEDHANNERIYLYDYAVNNPAVPADCQIAIPTSQASTAPSATVGTLLLREADYTGHRAQRSAPGTRGCAAESGKSRTFRRRFCSSSISVSLSAHRLPRSQQRNRSASSWPRKCRTSPVKLRHRPCCVSSSARSDASGEEAAEGSDDAAVAPVPFVARGAFAVDCCMRSSIWCRSFEIIVMSKGRKQMADLKWRSGERRQTIEADGNMIPNAFNCGPKNAKSCET
jgi:hypothetical protein